MIESFNAALVECVKACGGSAQMGAKLWPEKTPEAAQRALLDCLNEDRPAKLAPEQVLFILRAARAKGHHGGMEYAAASAGYGAPVPIDPRDELTELLRQNIELRRSSQRMDERIERLMQPTLRSAA